MPLSADDGWDTRLMLGASFCSVAAMLIPLPQPTRNGIGRRVGAFIFLNTHPWYFRSVRDPMNSDSVPPA